MKIVQKLDIVEVGNTPNPERRVVIIQREDGFYAFAEQYHYTTKHSGEIVVKGWHTLAANGVYADLNVAKNEGRAAFTRRHGIAY